MQVNRFQHTGTPENVDIERDDHEPFRYSRTTGEPLPVLLVLH